MAIQVTYRFARSRQGDGLLKKNRASTDALGLLETWTSASRARSYEVLYDEDSQERQDDTLVARLTTSQADIDANQGALDDLCRTFGLARELVGDPQP